MLKMRNPVMIRMLEISRLMTYRLCQDSRAIFSGEVREVAVNLIWT